MLCIAQSLYAYARYFVLRRYKWVVACVIALDLRKSSLGSLQGFS